MGPTVEVPTAAPVVHVAQLDTPATTSTILSGWLSQSNQVFIATVASTHGQQLEFPPYVRTTVSLSTSSVIRGSAPPSQILVEGGRAGNVTILAPHSPSFEIGHSYMVFSMNSDVVAAAPLVDAENMLVDGALVQVATVSAVVQSAGSASL
jgi:hypothetical protein